ncbi:hypothetical protein LEP1GSC060_1348 [Leptospira weilii serovar Ranarum str. ICFT]|uniref:Uncharacterized protein n=1 Tax=Leptospira weilii serovar Ranarum str. ICFT TaxID=1218598 RepID=N1WQV2_9LEPT|nr:hypothetical protein LEP1GSC060_1348 [Leptospira weilii serovar Ranarum str. ICFT]
MELVEVREPRRFGNTTFSNLGHEWNFDLMILKEMIQMIEYTEK